MGLIFKTFLDVGTNVYLVNGPALSPWTVSEVISAGHSPLYKLQKDGTDSFCILESSRLGKDMFLDRDDALAEFERRHSENGKAIRKKI